MSSKCVRLRRRKKCIKNPLLTNQILGGLNAPQNRAVFTKLPAALFISLCFCGSGVALAIDKPASAPHPKAAGGETQSAVATETAAAIQALGANPGTRQISSIVFKAVRSSPGNVLAIVDAAVRVAPKDAVPEIVTAATAAVPNPWKQVAYRRVTIAPDYKGGPDGKQGRDGGRNMDLGGREPGATGTRGSQGTSRGGSADPGSTASGGNLSNADSIFWNNGTLGTGGAAQFVFDPTLDGTAGNGSTMTLAEAIAQTAFQAQPGLSFPSLTNAVDIALRTNPAVLLGNIQGARSVSGVGDAGLSNYANEPLRTPKQPVVSR